MAEMGYTETLEESEAAKEAKLKVLDDEKAGLEAKQAASQAGYDTESARRDATEADRPERGAIPGAPSYSPFSSKPFVIASSALVMAAIAGPIFAKQGSAAAMNSLSGALEGLHAGNEARWKANMAEYKMHVDRIDSRYSEAIARHDRIMKQHDKKLGEKLHELNLFYKEIHGNEFKRIDVLEQASVARNRLVMNQQNNKTKADNASLSAAGKKGSSPFAAPEKDAGERTLFQKGADKISAPKTIAEALVKYKERNPGVSEAKLREKIKKDFPNLK